MTWLAETAMLAHGWRRFLMLLVAGAIAGLSVPPLFILPALFVTFPFWVWALDGAERRPGLGRLFGPAFAIGFAFGLGYFTVAFHWLGQAFFLEGGGWPIFVMPLAIAALAALIALFWGLGSALAHLFWSHSGWRIVVLATFLSLAEYARGTLLSGFPFDLLGYALTANPEMMQLASVIGVYGLTALCSLLVMTPALIWPADGRGLVPRLVPLFLAVAVIAAQVGWGHQRLTQTVLTDRTDMRARLVQPLLTAHRDALAPPPEIISRLIALTETKTDPSDQGLADITHVVWPESVLPFYLSTYPEALARIARMLPPQAMLLTGAPREPADVDGDPTENPGFNSIFAIDTEGEIVASYDKSHLVPFGEYL
ncbi:MAG: apolipoprotein N-acyltransferase, partial [Devosia sp.]